MITDTCIVDLGGESVKVHRLTLAEIRKDRAIAETGDGLILDEARQKMISAHVMKANGDPLDVDSLSLPQMRKIVKALVGLPDEGGLSDFIGLLC